LPNYSLLCWLAAPDRSACSGNPLLPTDLADFMVTRELLCVAGALLLGLHCPAALTLQDGMEFPCGKLYIQSNVEDVAIYMMRLIEDIKYSDVVACLKHIPTCCTNSSTIFSIPASAAAAHELYRPRGAVEIGIDHEWASSTVELCQPRRQKQWVDEGGRQAIGSGWLSHSGLPLHGRTETEVVREHEQKKVYRAVLICSKQPDTL
jgi:hypothetical protein